MRIIGLTGKARAGKDTVADFIVKAVPGAKRQGFADALKLSAARNWMPNATQVAALDFCNWLKSEGEVHVVCPESGVTVARATGREFLQRYGTEAHRDVFGANFWLDAVLPMGRVGDHGERMLMRTDCSLLVIPDVRFGNEAARVWDAGGEVWRIDRPGTEAVEAHASEVSIESVYVTRVIVNDGDLSDLEAKVLEAL